MDFKKSLIIIKIVSKKYSSLVEEREIILLFYAECLARVNQSEES